MGVTPLTPEYPEYQVFMERHPEYQLILDWNPKY